MAGRARKGREKAAEAEALCGCDAVPAGSGRQAAAVDPELKAESLTRLRRIEGQLRGLQRMVAEERYCTEILTQMASVQEALRAVARSLMRNHLKHCVATAHGSSDAERVYNELLDLIFRQSR
ncbi:MAG TPA: metal-sensitive transcriptional regulator [Vicinamibacteria bacterium]|nr:metal-sensitive transcriptional regulator [Vicinamibacteria bacterium]